MGIFCCIVEGMKIHVVCGGTSSEREVSLRSGNAVADALKKAGHEVTLLDVDAPDNQLRDCAIVFPVLHGSGGEDGTFQLRLEQLGLKYVGSDAKSSKLCMDKTAYRTFMMQEGFLMPGGVTVTYEEYLSHPYSTQLHVLKPVNGGSSIDTVLIRDETNRYENIIPDVFARNHQMILEQLIQGVELTIGVLGEQALPVIEIIPPTGGEFDYENKYNGATQELIPPIHADEAIQQKAQDIALHAHIAAGCRDFSRSDFIVSDDGKCYLLETNTIPGLTNQSLFPKMAQAAGFDMPTLCDNLVQMAARH